MKARQWGTAITSCLMLFAVFFAALQLLVLFHAARAEQGPQKSAASAPRVAPFRAPPARPQGERPAVKPPGEPHPPSRQFRPNEFAPRTPRRITS